MIATANKYLVQANLKFNSKLTQELESKVWSPGLQGGVFRLTLKTQMLLAIIFLTWITLVHHVSASAINPNPHYVKTFEGEQTIISAELLIDNTLLDDDVYSEINWYKMADYESMTLFIFHSKATNGHESRQIHENMASRVDTTNRSTILRINDTQLNDGGLYQCRIRSSSHDQHIFFYVSILLPSTSEPVTMTTTHYNQTTETIVTQETAEAALNPTVVIVFAGLTMITLGLIFLFVGVLIRWIRKCRKQKTSSVLLNTSNEDEPLQTL